MKIFIGAVNITDSLRILQKGFASLGVQADIATVEKSHAFYGDNENNVIDVAQLYKTSQVKIASSGALVVTPSKDFLKFAEQYDIFIIVSSHSLLPRLTDLPLLHSMGKTIVCYQLGSELRHEATSTAFWSAYGHVFPQNAYPTVHCRLADAGKSENYVSNMLLNGWPFMHNFLNKYYNTRMAERYATTICTNPSVFSLGIRPCMQVQLPFDNSICTFSPPRNQIPTVVHAPSNKFFKRTDLILKALLELQEEGVPFKLHFLEKMPNSTVLETLRQADVLIDQVVGDSIARLSLEAMASGCAVISGNSACVAWPPDRPAVSVTPLTLKERLREVLTDKKLRLDLAVRGYEYIRKGYHSPEGAAQSILDAIENEKNKKFDFYPTIFTEIATKKPDEAVPHFLQEMTLKILKDYGTSSTTDMQRLADEGFIPSGSAQEHVLRWDMSKMHKIGPWNWCGKHIPVPSFDVEHVFKGKDTFL